MATIKIPGGIHLDKSENNTKRDSISDESSIEEIIEVDPLDNEDITEIDFSENEEPNEHADVNIDLIAGDASGYDLPIIRLEQEIHLAEHDEANNRLDESLRHRIRVVALSRLIYPADHWKIGKYETDLAHSYIDLFGPSYAKQCEEHANLSLKILKQDMDGIFYDEELTEYLRAKISAFYALARAELILKKPSESEKSINKALLNLKKLEKMSDLTDDEVFPISLKLHLAAGKISLRLQDNISATNYYNTACNMIQTSKGSDSVDLIPIYQFLGKIEQNNGSLSNHSKAIEYYLMAHAIANKHYECHSEQVIQSSRTVATAYSLIGTVDSESTAEKYLQECIQSLNVVHGENHPLTFEINTELARLLIRSDRKSEALNKLKSNLKNEKVFFGEYSDEVLVTSKMLASLELSCGNVSNALKYYEQTLVLEELQNGPQSKSVRNIKEIIDNLRSQSKKPSGNIKTRSSLNETHRLK